jgi:uncharacterized protein DUF6559
MGWLGNLRRRRAAKAYVFKLGPWLRRAYGASRTYTAGQIERGAHELHLNPRFIVFGHAVFLDPTEFASIHGILPNAVTIEEARVALWRDLGAPPQFDPASSIGDAEGWGLGGLSDHGSAHHASSGGHGHGGHGHGGHGGD